jgi:hypothetical protein
VRQYNERGYQPYVTTYLHEGQQYYRVRLGIFETLAEANALKLELEDKYSVGTWIDIED